MSSEGTLFIDQIGSPIKINEWGVYAQATKKLFSEKLVLGISGRYDKNENFEGKFTPRFTALIKMAEGHNLRASYQTAYKFPNYTTTMDKTECRKCCSSWWTSLGT